MNRAIDERKFPSVLKIAKVEALYKKGDKNNSEIYWPISL